MCPMLTFPYAVQLAYSVHLRVDMNREPGWRASLYFWLPYIRNHVTYDFSCTIQIPWRLYFAVNQFLNIWSLQMFTVFAHHENTFAMIWAKIFRDNFVTIWMRGKQHFKCIFQHSLWNGFLLPLRYMYILPSVLQQLNSLWPGDAM